MYDITMYENSKAEKTGTENHRVITDRSQNEDEHLLYCRESQSSRPSAAHRFSGGFIQRTNIDKHDDPENEEDDHGSHHEPDHMAEN